MSNLNYGAMFDSVELTTVPGLTVLASDPYKPPKRNVQSSNLASSSASSVAAAFYTEKTIIVRVSLSRSNRVLLEQSIDLLMVLLHGIEKDLILAQSGLSRRYVATYKDYIIAKDGGSYCELDLIFELSDAFGYETALTQLVFAAGRTLYNYTDSFTVGGSAPNQVPIIKLTFTALTGSTTKDVTVLNPATNIGLTVNRTAAAGDVYVFDSQNMSVQVNGSDVEFTGGFPSWSNGPGYLQTTDGFLTRTKTVYAYYYKRYA